MNGIARYCYSNTKIPNSFFSLSFYNNDKISFTELIKIDDLNGFLRQGNPLSERTRPIIGEKSITQDIIRLWIKQKDYSK